MGIEIFSKDGCKYCDLAEDICKDLCLDYKKTKIEKGDLEKLCGKPIAAYPQIFIDGKHHGTFFDFQDYIEDTEPMLLPTLSRFTVFPIQHDNLWALYKQAQMSNWTAEEVDLSKDMDDWSKLTDNEQHFIKTILAFFAGSDGIVFENLNNNFAISFVVRGIFESLHAYKTQLAFIPRRTAPRVNFSTLNFLYIIFASFNTLSGKDGQASSISLYA